MQTVNRTCSNCGSLATSDMDRNGEETGNYFCPHCQTDWQPPAPSQKSGINLSFSPESITACRICGAPAAAGICDNCQEKEDRRREKQ